MKVHFIVHEAFEAPGAYETWVRERGHEAAYSRVYAHEPLPASIADIDLLVVMGGPQSPSTTREVECQSRKIAIRIRIATTAIVPYLNIAMKPE